MNLGVRHFDDDLAQLRTIAPWLREAIGSAVGDDVLASVMPMVDLALTEVCANILVHGEPQGADGFSVGAELVDDVLRVTVVDETAEFHLDGVAEPHIDEPQIHGYGIMIVRQLTSNYQVVRIGDANHSILDFALTQANPQKGPQ